jgi:hypothetical protein
MSWPGSEALPVAIAVMKSSGRGRRADVVASRLGRNGGEGGL